MLGQQLTATRPRVAPRKGRTNTLVVRAGLFGKKPATTKAPPAKKSGGLFSIGSKKAAAPAKPEKKGLFSVGSKKKAAAPAPKKSGGLFGSKGSKPAAAKKAKPAPKRAFTQKVGTKKVAPKKVAPKKAASSDGSGVELPFFGELKVGDTFKSGDGKYYANEVKGTKARGAQKAVGYKGSSEKGSAPMVDAQGSKAKYGGVVYRFGDKYGGNIDEFSPIFLPENRSRSGDVYEPGTLGLAVWFGGFASLLAVGGFAIYSTSALSG